MQAIQTTKRGASERKGARIKATAWAGTITLSYQYNLDLENNHRHAAEALRIKLGWTPDQGRAFAGPLVGGCLPNQDYCWVLVEGLPLTPAQRKAAQRERARREGKCITCCQADALEGLVVCGDCNESAADRKRNRPCPHGFERHDGKHFMCARPARHEGTHDYTIPT